MGLERVRRWHWVVLSLVVGLGLAEARRFDHDELPGRLGEGVADRAWFEREVRRGVTLADGSTVPAFSRLRVYPLTLRERGGRRPVHVVAGMYLAKVGEQGDLSGAAGGPVGKLRPYFFIAPVPYQPLAYQRAGEWVDADATVRDYLDSLRDDGVTYTYAWWAEPRYAMAAWVGGSFVLIGLLWPTALNLLTYGSFRAPPEEKGVDLWKLKPRRRLAPPPQPAWTVAPVASASGRHVAAPDRSPVTGPASATANRAPAPASAPVLSLAPAGHDDADQADHEQKEFGAQRDDFYPTELKVTRRADQVAG